MSKYVTAATKGSHEIGSYLILRGGNHIITTLYMHTWLVGGNGGLTLATLS